MSKLFDQLKNAARDREERSPGLLLEAMRRAKSAAPASAQLPLDGIPPEPSAVDDRAPIPAALPRAPLEAAQPSPSAKNAYAGIALAVAVFAAVAFAWNLAPWRAPQKIRIDPGELKLDRTLDLQRPAPKATATPDRSS